MPIWYPSGMFSSSATPFCSRMGCGTSTKGLSVVLMNAVEVSFITAGFFSATGAAAGADETAGSPAAAASWVAGWLLQAAHHRAAANKQGRNDRIQGITCLMIIGLPC